MVQEAANNIKSSTEVEYHVVTHTVTETLWLRYLLPKLGILIIKLIKVLCQHFYHLYCS